MGRASQFFTDGERTLVEEAVALAELRTSGEIVPVVATASGRYDRAEDLFGVVVALGLVAAGWLPLQNLALLEGAWGERYTWLLGLAPVLALFLAGFLAGAVLATVVPALRLPFISRGEIEAEVDRAARAAFHELRVRRTAGGTGILIYLSLFERTVRVLGDDAISEKLGQEQWTEVCDLVVDGIRAGRAAQGLKDAILRCGDLLAEHFPIEPGDRNELGNELRLID
jgi:putative membrane protein